MTDEEKIQDDEFGEGEVHGAVVGIIAPPPDLRVIVDKTAMFVAKNGKQFEAKILAKNDQDIKFAFLKPTSPYHKYYQHKVDELAVEIHKQAKQAKQAKQDAIDAKSGLAPKKEAPEPSVQSPPKTESDSEEKIEATVAKAPKLKMIAQISGNKKNRTTVEPPSFNFLLEHPDTEFVTLSPARLDLIKLTARFTAAIGREFLSQVAVREVNNPEFDFLKPTSSLFTYFSSYVDSYNKIIQSEKQEEVFGSLKTLYQDKLTVLDRCVHRIEWEQALAEREAAAAEGDSDLGQKMSLLQIDWHDFVVVETISFEEEKSEDPTKKAKNGKTVNAVEKSSDEAVNVDVDMDMDMDVDMDVDMDESDEEKIEVRDNYEPNVKTGEQRQKIVALPDGRRIDADALNEHVRVELIDPAYKEQQERHMRKKQNLPFVQKDISKHLAKLASHRPDVFAVDEDAAKEAVEEEVRKRAEKGTVVWDGSTNSVADVTLQAQQRLLQKQSEEPAKKRQRGA